MKIAISSTGPNLDAQIDPRFGRCRYFVVVDPATKDFEVLDNDAATLSGGAGIQAAQMVASAGVDAVITGSLGPNASDVLAATGLKVYLGAAGTEREVLQKYEDGRLQEVSGISIGGRPGPGGFGAGMGIGRGRGRGIGICRGMGWRYTPEPQPTPVDELEELKREKDRLREQMKRIEKRIKDLEKKG